MFYKGSLRNIKECTHYDAKICCNANSDYYKFNVLISLNHMSWQYLAWEIGLVKNMLHSYLFLHLIEIFEKLFALCDWYINLWACFDVNFLFPLHCVYSVDVFNKKFWLIYYIHHNNLSYFIATHTFQSHAICHKKVISNNFYLPSTKTTFTTIKTVF